MGERKLSNAVHRWFFVGVAILFILLNSAAFLPSLVDPSMRSAPLPLTPLVSLHATIAVVWLLLFLTQATLVAIGQTSHHRRLGVIGISITLAFVLTGIATVIEQVRRGFELSGDLGRLPLPPGVDPQSSMLGPLFSVIVFAILSTVAIGYRHRPAVHKRLMALAVLEGLIPTPVAHVIGHSPALQPVTPVVFTLSLLVALLLLGVYDRVSEGKLHWVTKWVGLAVFLATLIFNIVVVPSPVWHNFTVWLIQ